MDNRAYIKKFKEAHGRMPSQVELSRDLKISKETAIKLLIQFHKELPNSPEQKAPVLGNNQKAMKQKKSFLIMFLRAVLLLIAAMAFVLSVYFTGMWFAGKFHWAISGLISLTMVMFMVVSTQCLRYTKGFMVKMLIYVSFSIAFLFSIGSTIAGQYTALTVKQTENVAQTNSGAAMDLREKKREALESRIEEKKGLMSVHQSTLEMLSSTEEGRLENWQSIATERKNIDRFMTEIDGLYTQMDALDDEVFESMEQFTVEQRDDFYTFMAEMFGIEVSRMEFIIAVLPAVFVDLISALSLNLFLFIRKENER